MQLVAFQGSINQAGTMHMADESSAGPHFLQNLSQKLIIHTWAT